jgi:starvation-inducible outer membrane lipoprotein
MKKLILISMLLLSGCISVPVDRTFPKIPDSFRESVPDLTPLSVKNPQLSDIISNANDNYSEYYKLRNRYNEWINWYDTQKKIFESVK